MSNVSSIVNNLDPALTSQPQAQAENTDEMGKQEFLQLLVTQLENQDPLNPMTNEDFAVQLAQFSQVEQLIAINDNTAEAGSSNASSLAGYLGNEVMLDTSTVSMSGGQGNSINFDLPENASNVQVEFLDENGNAVQTISLGATAAGNKWVSLNEAGVPDGDYQMRVTSLNEDGTSSKPSYRVGGTVSGFIPGPEPKLIVDGKEVSPVDVNEVRMPS